MDNVTSIVLTLATVLTSAGAWQFYQNRLKMRHAEKKHDQNEQTLFRDDLRERVAILEQKLEDAYKEKNKTAQRLAEVMQEVAAHKVRIEFLEKENDRLKQIGR